MELLIAIVRFGWFPCPLVGLCVFLRNRGGLDGSMHAHDKIHGSLLRSASATDVIEELLQSAERGEEQRNGTCAELRRGEVNRGTRV